MSKKYDSMTYEWRRGKVVVHGWGTYPSYSVLAGQAKKMFVDSFDTEEEAQAAYPEAKASHPMMQEQNTFDHLPDGPDY